MKTRTFQSILNIYITVNDPPTISFYSSNFAVDFHSKNKNKKESIAIWKWFIYFVNKNWIAVDWLFRLLKSGFWLINWHMNRIRKFPIRSNSSNANDSYFNQSLWLLNCWVCVRYIYGNGKYHKKLECDLDGMHWKQRCKFQYRHGTNEAKIRWIITTTAKREEYGSLDPFFCFEQCKNIVGNNQKNKHTVFNLIGFWDLTVFQARNRVGFAWYILCVRPPFIEFGNECESNHLFGIFCLCKKDLQK